MKTLLLAAGFGVRLREIFHGRPKHLISIGGHPFLHHLLSLAYSKDMGTLERLEQVRKDYQAGKIAL